MENSMSKLLLTAGTVALMAIGAGAPAMAKPKSVISGVNQSTTFGNTGHVKANNIRLCNNRCTFQGDYSGNVVGIGNQNLGPTTVNPGKAKGHYKAW
jgi:hypothetical protein